MKHRHKRGIAALGLALLGAGTAPVFALDPEAGLAAERGRVTYVDFWASWCVPCAEAFPWLNAMQAKYAAQGFKVVAVGLDEQPSRGDRFLQAHPPRFAVVRDPTGLLAERYAVEGMPYAVLLDQNGRVIHRHIGFRAAEAAEYEKAIESALAAPAPASGVKP